MKNNILILLFTACIAISCNRKAQENFEYASKFYKIQLTDTVPFIKYLSVDGLGESKLENNPVLWNDPKIGKEYEMHVISASEVKIYHKTDKKNATWSFKFEEGQFTITSQYQLGMAMKSLDLRFEKIKNHTTLLGIMPSKNMTVLPALLNFPDMGSFQLRADKAPVMVGYDARRYGKNGYILLSLPVSEKEQGSISYSFRVASVYPYFEGVKEQKYAGFRRNYLNLFQINPRLRVLANNSCSDPCAFTLFKSSMIALNTPPLVDSLNAIDLLRMSVERYLNGMKAYGLVGYVEGYEGADVSPWMSPYNSLDSYPSLIIAACNYIKGTKDIEWAKKFYPRIKAWMDSQMKRDYDGNGLVEYELTGNSGSWDGSKRPANWWDTIGFGFEDAFSNAITYEALNLIVFVAEMLDNKDDAKLYRSLSRKIKGMYFKTFYNPKTGVLAGWKSKDGKLHDYYFLSVNSMAVYYNLVPAEKERDIMKIFWNKMEEVGFKNFYLGLPGNLVSVRREDYTHHDPRWGGGELEDGSDAFQRYENGGASLNWTYFALKAFEKTGLKDQLLQISEGILNGINDGDFQGPCEGSDMTKDWKTWNGECWGYEGFLCDGYLVMLALNPDDNDNNNSCFALPSNN